MQDTGEGKVIHLKWVRFETSLTWRARAVMAQIKFAFRRNRVGSGVAGRSAPRRFSDL